MNQKRSLNELQGAADMVSLYHQYKNLKLPPSALKLIEWIGVAPAITLIAAHGNVRKYIPSPERLTEDHWLIELIGDEPARKLCAKLSGSKGGGDFLVPACPDLIRVMAVDLYCRGHSIASLAERFSRNERTINRWIARFEAARGRLATRDMFEELEA